MDPLGPPQDDIFTGKEKTPGHGLTGEWLSTGPGDTVHARPLYTPKIVVQEVAPAVAPMKVDFSNAPSDASAVHVEVVHQS